jgi:hypothetical protein
VLGRSFPAWIELQQRPLADITDRAVEVHIVREHSFQIWRQVGGVPERPQECVRDGLGT